MIKKTMEYEMFIIEQNENLFYHTKIQHKTF